MAIGEMDGETSNPREPFSRAYPWEHPYEQQLFMRYIVTVQPGHLLAPEKRRGQEASGVRPMSNPMKKRLHKQKRACDTLFHGVCRLSELLRYIFYEYKF